MSLSIRTNVASLTAQRNLYATQSSLDSSLSKLSSGFRITKAGDDAAGLGISTKLESQIRSYTQATRNANDGISVVQATESALNEQANILTRLRELAMQSGSDGVGNSERAYIQKESTALVAELQRISQTAEYNGTKLLDGSLATLDFQVGIAATGNDRISLNTLNATTAGAGAGSPAGIVAVAPSTGVFQPWVAAAVGGVSAAYGSSTDTGAAFTAGENAAIAAGASPAQANRARLIAAYAVGYYYRDVGDPNIYTFALPASATRDAALTLAANVANGGSGGDVKLAAAQQSFASTYAATGDAAAAGLAAYSVVFAASLAAGNPDAGNVGLSARFLTENLFGAAASVSGGAGTPAGDAAGLKALGYAAGVPTTASPGGLGVAGLSLASKSGALSALASIDSALATISSNRATLGAAGNRFQSAISNIQAFSESLSAANSRIKDVDVAEETSRMSRSQILMQAGVSVLAQANQMPQMALKLLG